MFELGTDWAGGVYKVIMIFPDEYPSKVIIMMICLMIMMIIMMMNDYYGNDDDDIDDAATDDDDDDDDDWGDIDLKMMLCMTQPLPLHFILPSSLFFCYIYCLLASEV